MDGSKGNLYLSITYSRNLAHLKCIYTRSHQAVAEICEQMLEIDALCKYSHYTVIEVYLLDDMTERLTIAVLI